MRTLSFIVDDQIIKKDPNCDFIGLIPGTEGYLQAEFSFSPQWDGCTKVAAFWSVMGHEYPPKKLDNGKTCLIPAEALQKKTFGIQIIGKKQDFRLTTNKLFITQKGDAE